MNTGLHKTENRVYETGFPFRYRKIRFRDKTSPMIALLAFLCQVVAYGADKEAVPVPPPMPKSLTVSTAIGRPVEIPLSIGGRIVEPMSVMIRKPPRLGRLGDVRRTGRSTAAVLYTPDPGAGQGEDRFTFAAQSNDSPVSAAATVRIELIEEPPCPEFPEELDFGTVFLGDTVEKKIVIRNSGGGIASWLIKPNPPWNIAGSGSYKLAGGRETIMRLVFAPAEERDFRDRIQMAADSKSVLAVSGAGVSPVSWAKEGIVFTPQDRGKGTTEMKVNNQTPDERTLMIEWPEFLKAPGETVIPPSGAAVLQVQVVGGPQVNFQGEATARSGNFVGRIPIRIYPAPAKLETNPERVLKLGGHSENGPQKNQFLVRNTGGSDAPLEILAPAELHITPDSRDLILRAGQDQVFEVELHSAEPAPRKIRIQSPACEPIELSVESPASQQSKSSLPVENFLSLPQKPLESPAMVPSLPGRIPSLEMPEIVSSDPHEIVLKWKSPSPGGSDFRIERRTIVEGSNGGVAFNWIPWQGAKITTADGIATAHLEKLAANSQWTIHLVPLDENGVPGQPSPAFQIATKTITRLRIPWWVWLLPAGALAYAAVRFWRGRQMLLQIKDNERIARLEGK
jgi:hypothetical protein